VAITQNLDRFGVKLFAYADDLDHRQRYTFQRSARRIEANIKEASRMHSSSGRLNRVGRATGPNRRIGAPLAVKVEALRGVNAPAGAQSTFYRFTGSAAWGLIDNSLTSGDSDGHIISPGRQGFLWLRVRGQRGSNQPRPGGRVILPDNRSAAEKRGGNSLRPGIWHPGSKRQPYWSRAIEKGGRQAMQLHQREFRNSGIRANRRR
jgi:hypothetical protein